MSSKFKGILERAKERESETPFEEPEAPPSPAPSPVKRGRPSGKRSDADFIQVTAYIRKTIHREVKIALLKSGNDQDFSELVDALLETWVQSRT